MSAQTEKPFEEHLSWCKGMLVWHYCNPLPHPEPAGEVNVAVILPSLADDVHAYFNNNTTRFGRNVWRTELDGKTLGQMVAYINAAMDWNVTLDQEKFAAWREERHQKMVLDAVKEAQDHARSMARHQLILRVEGTFRKLYDDELGSGQPEPLLTYEEAKAWADEKWEKVKRLCQI